MSRHQLPAKNPRYEVVVGWDPLLRTYFAQVFDKDGKEDEQPFIWLGADLCHVTSTEIRAAIAPYAEVPRETAELLTEDRKHDRG